MHIEYNLSVAGCIYLEFELVYSLVDIHCILYSSTRNIIRHRCWYAWLQSYYANNLIFFCSTKLIEKIDVDCSQ
jgi:hypothetical protein